MHARTAVCMSRKSLTSGLRPAIAGPSPASAPRPRLCSSRAAVRSRAPRPRPGLGGPGTLSASPALRCVASCSVGKSTTSFTIR
eukprot:11405316-Heterocapsa_arctica.AAC.1